MLKSFLYSLTITAILLQGCKKSSTSSETEEQKTIIHYLFYPALLSDTLSRKIWHHNIDFRGLNTEKRELYFLVKEDLPKSEMLKILTLDSTKIEYAPCSTGMCEFGGMRGKIDGFYAFKIPCSNLKIPDGLQFNYTYKDSIMPITMKDMMNLQNEKSYYNTEKTFDLSPFLHQEIYANNIGAYISLKDKDKIVKALTEKLTQGLDRDESKAQALLDFVTNYITYSYEDFWYQSEITKRAHEVLISGIGDCSAKSTLYASMLEQCDIPYCLLYYQNHVNVGVAGKFEQTNPYHHQLDGMDYIVAETTVKDFKIGKTVLAEDEILKQLLFYQIPRKSSAIIDKISKKPLTFIEIEE